MSNFLLKTEPTEYSIDDLKREKVTSWFGVRNYQARNIIRDDMKVGDVCVIYHSSCAIPSAVGIGKVVKEAYPDKTQFDKNSPYYDKGSSVENPRWMSVDIQFIEKFATPITLTQMRTVDALSDMRLLVRGNRLSVLPITLTHLKKICARATGC